MMTQICAIILNDYKQLVHAIDEATTHIQDYGIEFHEEVQSLIEFLEIKRTIIMAVEDIQEHIHQRFLYKEQEGDALLKQLELNTDKSAEHWMAIISGQKEPEE